MYIYIYISSMNWPFSIAILNNQRVILTKNGGGAPVDSPVYIENIST